MIASTQITSTQIFAFIVFLVFKLLSRKVLLTDRNNRIGTVTIETVEKRLLFKKMANFTGKVLQNYK